MNLIILANLKYGIERNAKKMKYAYF